MAHAHVRGTLVLHVFRDTGWGHQPRGAAVGAEVAISCKRSKSSFRFILQIIIRSYS